MKLDVIPCAVCGKAFKKKQQRQSACSKRCEYERRKGKIPQAALAARWSEGGRESARAYLSSGRNPIYRPDVRRKAQIALRESGYQQFKHGGRQGLTVPQRLLTERLGWPTEIIVKTNCLTGRARARQERATFRPHKYTLDIADPILKIDIEIDGPSHNSRKQADAKRDAKLTELGWTVLRFTNRQVLSDLESVVRQIMQAVKSITCKPPPAITSPKVS